MSSLMRPLLLFATATIALGASTTWAAPAAERDPRFAEAEAQAQRRESAAAIDVYKALLGEGRDGAALRYNLGTLLLDQDGRLGEAVLHLRQAERLDPLDDDVRHNLSVALDRRVDRLGGAPSGDVVASIGRRVPPLWARLAFSIPALLLAALIALSSSARAWSIGVVRALALVSALATAAGAGVLSARRHAEQLREAVVLVDEVVARKDANTAAEASFPAHAGLYGAIVDETGDFVRLRFENGVEAWVERGAVGIVE